MSCCALALSACRKQEPQAAPLPAQRVQANPTSSGAAAHSGAPASSARPAQGNEARRDACVFRVGAKPRDTLDAADPVGSKIPIDHFVVVLQENRSFDQYFQALPQSGQPDVDVAPTSFDNADPSGEGAIVHPYLLKIRAFRTYRTIGSQCITSWRTGK